MTLEEICKSKLQTRCAILLEYRLLDTVYKEL